jgi:GNAT superfamily N-acetyltransferase
MVARVKRSPARQNSGSRAQIGEAMAAGEYVAWLAHRPGEPERIVGGAGVQLRRLLPRPDADGRRVLIGREGIVLNVYVERDYRRRGVARRLMEAIISWCPKPTSCGWCSTRRTRDDRSTRAWDSSPPTRCATLARCSGRAGLTSENAGAALLRAQRTIMRRTRARSTPSSAGGRGGGMCLRAARPRCAPESQGPSARHYEYRRDARLWARAVSLPSGERRLHVPFTRSHRLPAMPLDLTGLAPTVRIPPDVRDAVDYARKLLATRWPER